MTRFVVSRLGQSLLVLMIMSFVIYGLIGLMPGDPIDMMIASDPMMTPADAERMRALYGLDKPIIERYFNWAGAALSGDLGYSRLYAQPVLSVIGPALGNSVQLLACAIGLSVSIAVPLGVLADCTKRSVVEEGMMVVGGADDHRQTGGRGRCVETAEFGALPLVARETMATPPPFFPLLWGGGGPCPSTPSVHDDLRNPFRAPR